MMMDDSKQMQAIYLCILTSSYKISMSLPKQVNVIHFNFLSDGLIHDWAIFKQVPPSLGFKDLPGVLMNQSIGSSNSLT